jgi:glycosyltransferase involved in cell wall biosynthesis
MRSAWFLTRAFKVIYVANSMHSARQFNAHASPAMPRVVYNGFVTERLFAHRRRRNSIRRMAYVGRIVPGKNAHLVIDMFNAIADDHKDLELHFLGSGSMERATMDDALKSRARRRIFFHGWVNDMPGQLSTMDLVLFPSSYESFGNVLAECLLNGLPVLTSDLPAFEEIHGEKKTFCIGTLTQPNGSIERFVQAVREFDTLAAKAFDVSTRVAEKFNMPDHLKAIEAVYAEL